MEESNITSSIDELFRSTSWLQFGLLLLIIVLSLLSIRLLIFIFDNLSHQSRFASRIRAFFQFILDHIEPFIILMVFGYFISINPPLHGIIALVICIGGYRQIRDYITGKALKYNGALVSGSHLTVGNISGEIGHLRRLGVQVISKDATHFFSYVKLYDQGFTVHASDAYGGYYPLNVAMIGEDINTGKLRSFIINSPYTDDFGDVRITESNEKANEVSLSVHLRNASHLEHLKNLLRARGYECS